MESYVINGGNKIYGSVKIESAKNSVLPIIAGAIVCDGVVRIKECPKIADVLSMVKIIKSIGITATFDKGDLIIDSRSIKSCLICKKDTHKLRSSILLMGALLAKMRKVCLSYPGGCEIGIRPIDIHINSLKSLGAEIKEIGGEIWCAGDKLKGGEVYLDFPSVGATENIILSCVLATGRTVIRNAAKEPEIVDLANFLNRAGAKIKGAGENEIVIEGVKKLTGTEFKPMSDRIEAGTFMIAGALTGGELEILNVNSKNLAPLIGKLCDNTCKISISNDIIYIKSGRSKNPIFVKTGPYPFFPTDLQPQISVLASVSQGVSVIEENVFEMRFKHMSELKRMGADINVLGRTAIINGVRALNGATVTAFDLRGGAAMTLAGLVAEGTTVVNDVRHIERGYLDLDKKLNALGVDIIKIKQRKK